MQTQSEFAPPIILSRQQIVAHEESNARINIYEGAVRSGKSHTALRRFLTELRIGPKGEYIIVGKSERTVLHNVIEPLNSEEFLDGTIRYNRGLGELKIYDKKVYVVGANDERAEGKIRGSTLAGALVDEATIIPESFFKMLLSRLSIEGAKLFATTNPDSPLHWLKTDFIDRQSDLDISVFKFTLDDNPSLGEVYKNNLKREYKGLWYKRFILGDWVLAEGSIYDFFDTSIHTVRQSKTYAKQWYLGIDYGTTNAFAAVLVGFNDEQHPALWTEKEYYWDSKAMGYQKTDTEYAIDIEREFGGYPIQLIYLDPSAASFEVELRRQKKPVKQANNDVLDGIRYVGSLIAQGDLVICHACKHLIKEIESYVWDAKSVKLGEDKPVKQRDHAVDAMRYVLYSHFGKRTSLKPANVVDRFAEAEQRKWKQNPMSYPGYTNSPGWQRF
jgi:PBSX family phage terminase large subunit